jgi:hypothetical protein
MPGRLRDLDETFVTLTQHPPEVQDVLVTHGVHRRAVEIGLA